MRLSAPFIRLPFQCDASALATEVRKLAPELWRAHPEGHTGNTALPLVALGGNPDDDGVAGPMRPTPVLAKCPGIRAVMAALDAPIGRSRLMRIEGNAEATMHVDTNYYWQQRVRVHVPIVTTPNVRFLCGDADINMAPGEMWIFDTWRMHNVINPEPTERIHLVIDTVGSPAFWQWADESARGARTQIRFIGTDATTDSGLTFEARNFPVAMRPEEQRRFIDWLRADLFHPTQTAFGSAGVFFGLIEQFHHRWSQSCTAHATHEQLAALLNAFANEIAPFQGQLKLANGSDAAFIARQWLITPALNPMLENVYANAATASPFAIAPSAPLVNEARANGAPPSPSARTPAPARATAKPARKTRFDRPVFIVAAPRSGSTLLFETLLQSPDFYTVGGEAHGFFERFDVLKPAKTGWQSNQASAALATGELTALLESVLLTALINRDQALIPASNSPFRFLEKTPKNALRIPMLSAMFPDARFIYLYREPRDNVSSIIDAWQSGGFVTYPDLPQWAPLKWSLALIPGWRDLIGKPLGEIAAQQWAIVNQIILDDLSALPREQWCTVSYDTFLANPNAEAARLCNFAGVSWDRPIDGALKLSRHTLTAPDPQKWRRNFDVLREGWARVEAVAERAREIVGGVSELSLNEPIPAGTSLAASAPTPLAQPPALVAAAASRAASAAPIETAVPHPFSSTPSANLAHLLQQLKISVAITTYQSNQLLLVRSRNAELNTHFVEFKRPMGMIGDGRRLFWAPIARSLNFATCPTSVACARTSRMRSTCHACRM